MDVYTFSKIHSDKAADDLKKLQYKYPEDFSSYLAALKDLYMRALPLRDFSENALCYVPAGESAEYAPVKLLLRPQTSAYGVRAAEEEIASSASIEGIDYDRVSIRNILRGQAPQDEEEDRILGQKKGLQFISDRANRITEENLRALYALAIEPYLPESDRLQSGRFYRHDSVQVVSDRVKHTGIDHRKLPERMGELIAFANAAGGPDDLTKAAVIHFYFSYLHPYFDGNGRMARMLHLWFLVQRGYASALFVPFSSHIDKTRRDYYGVYTLVERNAGISGVVDVTPFIRYFSRNVYEKMGEGQPEQDTLAAYKKAQEAQKITPKESALWAFALSRYGTGEFSTKQLERDYGGAAYATIRTFVLKFSDLGLLTPIKYGSRTRYKIR